MTETARSAVPEAAAAGFGAGASAYERGRPAYPRGAVDWIVSRCGIDRGSTVVDVGAGTGIFTALLLGTGARVVAVEPVASMRARIPTPALAAAATAEALPLRAASARALVAAQAFHWFRHDEALAEAARVLRPGGHLALVWNRRDESVEWVARMSEVIGWRTHQISEYDRTDWPAVIGRSSRFGPVEHRAFAWEHAVDRETLAERVRSVSYVAAMEAGRREALVDEVLALVDGFPPSFPLPYTTLAWCTTRV